MFFLSTNNRFAQENIWSTDWRMLSVVTEISIFVWRQWTRLSNVTNVTKWSNATEIRNLRNGITSSIRRHFKITSKLYNNIAIVAKLLVFHVFISIAVVKGVKELLWSCIYPAIYVGGCHQIEEERSIY